MRGIASRAVAVCWLGMGLACGPAVELSDSGDGDESTSATPTTTTTALPGTSSTQSPTATTGESTTSLDTGEADDGYEEDDGGTGCTFTCPPPPPPSTTGGGTSGCDCPQGEKCMPWASDGGMDWNSIRCAPVGRGQPGDPCTAEGSQWSGLDDCEFGTMCFGVDPETLEGHCAAFCDWFGGGTCGQGYACETQAGEMELPLCVASCDPTAPDCSEGLGCFASGSSFACQTTEKMRAPVGSPCSDASACVSGALCAQVGLDCDQAPGEGCCGQVCDVNAPDPCGGETCTPWFGGAGAAEWEHVGYCVP